MASKWDATADRDMHVAMIDVIKPKSIDWAAVSEKMKAQGYNFSTEAIRQHFQKNIRQKASATTNDNGGSASTPGSATATPKKSRAKKDKDASTPVKTPRRKKAGADATPLPANGNVKKDVEDEDEELESPAKRYKRDPFPAEENGDFF